VQRHCDFDEAVALKQVLLRNPKLSAVPGTRYIYSNIGYWLLGGIIAIAAAQPFEDFVREQVLQPLGIAPRDVSFTIPDACQHAIGYLEKYSLLNFMKGLLAERDLFGTYEGHWLRIEPHYVNGPAFGGLIGSARGFEIFLQDQLKPQSALFDEPTRRLFYEQQKTRSGQFVKMTLGWHIGKLGSRKYFFKEGGGGGFHCTMRLYADAGIASIVMSNATGFNSNACLDLLDANFL
jgi:D-alanyl-D-alanine carboxypeptidase